MMVCVHPGTFAGGVRAPWHTLWGCVCTLAHLLWRDVHPDTLAGSVHAPYTLAGCVCVP